MLYITFYIYDVYIYMYICIYNNLTHTEYFVVGAIVSLLFLFSICGNNFLSLVYFFSFSENSFFIIIF